ncbi:MAG: hypothetical protein Q8927_08600 [Bacteroidota bacterium]|nr:hypothetical protein [Bacteroidota bacterium]MDP4253696.1 hypothetical protein [Bacteroidota bacterium]MDP4259980.1 hypothetical protein [Bacteroidota bacterium]
MQNKGAGLFKGSPGDFEKLKLWVKKDSKEYTRRILQSQLKAAADKVWQDEDYKKFIELVDQIGLDEFPRSYSKKYEIATRKLSK